MEEVFLNLDVSDVLDVLQTVPCLPIVLPRRLTPKLVLLLSRSGLRSGLDSGEVAVLHRDLGLMAWDRVALSWVSIMVPHAAVAGGVSHSVCEGGDQLASGRKE